MNVIVFLIIGLFSGWIASSLVEGHGIGALGDMIVGIIGAFLGGFLFSMLGITAYGFWGSFGMSVIGSVLFLWVLHLFTGTRHSRRSARLLNRV